MQTLCMTLPYPVTPISWPDHCKPGGATLVVHAYNHHVCIVHAHMCSIVTPGGATLVVHACTHVQYCHTWWSHSCSACIQPSCVYSACTHVQYCHTWRSSIVTPGGATLVVHACTHVQYCHTWWSHSCSACIQPSCVYSACTHVQYCHTWRSHSCSACMHTCAVLSHLAEPLL